MRVVRLVGHDVFEELFPSVLDMDGRVGGAAEEQQR
jgi:hypothetical protein